MVHIYWITYLYSFLLYAQGNLKMNSRLDPSMTRKSSFICLGSLGLATYSRKSISGNTKQPEVLRCGFGMTPSNPLEEYLSLIQCIVNVAPGYHCSTLQLPRREDLGEEHSCWFRSGKAVGTKELVTVLWWHPRERPPRVHSRVMGSQQNTLACF